MIRAVLGHGGGETAFLAAAEAQPLPGIELASAWYAFGKGQARGAQGWHFFAAGADEPPFALAVRRGTAWACGLHDPGELGEFLRWAGISRLTARLPGGDEPSFAVCPDGFVPAERMLGLLRPYGGAGQGSAGESADTLAGAGTAGRPSAYGQGAAIAPCGAPNPFPAGYRLIGQTDAARIAEFLRQEGAFAVSDRTEASERQAQQNAARLFAQEMDARAAIGLGYAALLLGPGRAEANTAGVPAGSPGRGCQERAAEQPDAASAPPMDPEAAQFPAAAMAVTTTVFAKAVCLSALQVRADLRGQGLGSRMVQLLAAEAGRYARGVCLLCRPGRAGFYSRLGFVPEGEYACFVPAR